MINRRGYLGKIVLYLILLFPGSLLMGYIVQKFPPVLALDRYLFVLINGLPHNALIDRIIYPFDLWFPPWKVLFMPMFLYFMLVPFFVYMLIRRTRMSVYALVATIIGSSLAGLLLAMHWHFMFRPRPFLSLPTEHLNDGYRNALRRWPTFPSGHTRDTAVYSTIINHFVPNMRWVVVGFTIFIAFTRVYTGEHYPMDVLGGIIFGYIAGSIGLFSVILIDDVLHTRILTDEKTQTI